MEADAEVASAQESPIVLRREERRSYAGPTKGRLVDDPLELVAARPLSGDEQG